MAHSNVLVLPTKWNENDSAAIITPSTRSAPQIEISYKHLVAIIACLQLDLAGLGIQKASKVALVLPNGPEYVAVFLSILRQRGTAAPLDTQCTESEFKDIFSRMKPELVVLLPPASSSSNNSYMLSPAVRAALDLRLRIAFCRRKNDHRDDAALKLQLAIELVESGYGDDVPSATFPKAIVYSRNDVWSEDGALMLFTSGTTGAPKSVILSHTNLLVAIRIIITNHQLSSADRTIIITPLHHIIGVCGSLLATLFSGGCAVIPDSLPGAFWQYCTEYDITWFHAVPTLHRLLLKFPRPEGCMPAKLRFLRSGGSEMAPDLYTSLVALGPPLLEVYGMTETAPAIFCNRLDEDDDTGTRQRSHYPIPDAVDVVILVSSGTPDNETNDRTLRSAGKDFTSRLTKEPGIVGEVCVRGKNLMAGYVDNTEASSNAILSNGYFRTGDLGAIQPSGKLKLVGRLKEVINKGGVKIGPTEVEHAALSHELVSDAACFRIADILYGEEIGLAVTLGVGVEKDQCTENDLKRHIRDQLAAFKVPKKIVFLEAIEYNRTGKPLRTYLSQKFAEGHL